jgi:hypothetical protein
MSDATKKLADFGHSVTSGPTDIEAALRRRQLSCMLRADAAAADNEEHIVWHNQTGYTVRIVAASLVYLTTAAANGSNFTTQTIGKQDGAGGATTAYDALATSATAFTADVPRAFAMASTDTIANGEVLVIDQVKSGTGVALAVGYLSVVLEFV